MNWCFETPYKYQTYSKFYTNNLEKISNDFYVMRLKESIPQKKFKNTIFPNCIITSQIKNPLILSYTNFRNIVYTTEPRNFTSYGRRNSLPNSPVKTIQCPIKFHEDIFTKQKNIFQRNRTSYSKNLKIKNDSQEFFFRNLKLPKKISKFVI